MSSAVQLRTITTDIPARLDRLPWAKFHWLVVVGLGTVWILDGLEVTIVGSMSEALKPANTGLGMSNFDIGLAGAVYVAGCCVGALVFGQLTDRLAARSFSSSRLRFTPSRPSSRILTNPACISHAAS
jgi:MFS family permease